MKLLNTIADLIRPVSIIITLLISGMVAALWFLGWKISVAFFLFIIIICILWYIPRWQNAQNKKNGITGRDLADLEDAYRRTLSQIIGGSAVILGIYFTWSSLELTQRTLEQSERRATAEMFSQGIEQLTASHSNGKPKVATRLGGIYTLRQIALSTSDYFYPIVSIFNAYLQSNLLPGDKNVQSTAGDLESRGDIAAIFKIIGDKEFFSKYTDRFGQAVIRIPMLIAPHIVMRNESLAGLNFDHPKLSESDFTKSRFLMVQFIYADLRFSKFDEIVVDGLRFKKGSPILDFTYGNLTGASFRDAKLSGTGFYVSILDNVNFEGAELDGVEFSHVDLSTVRGLTCRQIKGATLKEVKLPKNMAHCSPNI
ncbi:MAG: pentapeptide repeat-containing protein [Candidatus Electrothrix sp. AW3_4]|nr:pentapeptide repeat-containing protein [Candidatus Electrothrix gigas]